MPSAGAPPEVQVACVDDQGSKRTGLLIWITAQIWRMPLTVMMLLLTLVAQCWAAPQVGSPSLFQV